MIKHIISEWYSNDLSAMKDQVKQMAQELNAYAIKENASKGAVYNRTQTIKNLSRFIDQTVATIEYIFQHMEQENREAFQRGVNSCKARYNKNGADKEWYRLQTILKSRQMDNL